MDQKIALYQQSVDAYARYLKVIENKYQAGSESRATLAQAQAQLESSPASALDYQWQRAQLEQAIALLVGKTPAEFSLPAATLPSQLLQRRPDVAYAEHNATISSDPERQRRHQRSALHNLFSLPYRV
nr:Peptidoglycan synthase FtsI precursor [Candidatus Pantoea persica]